MNFNELPILEQTKNALEEINIKEPTKVQEKVIPLMIEGHDIICQSQTGTGKTFAFSIPIIEKINPNNKEIQSLILTPTRELSIQVYREILKLVKFYPKLKVTLIVGGESYERQFRELAKNPHIIIATPGRIIDHINRGKVDLSHLEILTLDEADEMLKMGFKEDLEYILKTTPSSRQTVLFSATIPNFIKKISNTYLNNPITVKIENKTLTVDKISEHYYLIKEEDKLSLTTRLLDLYQPNSCIIFTNTKKRADEVALTLQDQNYLADSIHGDLKQSERNYVMSRFRNKLLKVLTATDVAARGIDILDVDLVINYDLPEENEVYVHRIGRTGRAGKKGMSISYVTPRRKYKLEEIKKLTKSNIKLEEIPSEDDIYKSRINNFKQHLVNIMEKDKDYHLKKFEEFLKDENIKNMLINSLINEIIPVKKQYEKVDILSEYQKNERVRKNKEISNYVDLKINLGRTSGMTPQMLFKIVQKELDIHQRNIGDIKILNNETIFGIKKDFSSKIKKNKTFVNRGKKLTIKKVG